MTESDPGPDGYSGTWAALLDYACGEVGIPESEFWKMTWNEYQRRVNGYNLREWRAWDRTRLLAVQVYNSVFDKPKTPQQYLPLPIDAVDATTDPTESEDAFWARMQAEGRL